MNDSVGQLPTSFITAERSIQSLTQYTTLGKSGLRVSPLCLGTGGNFNNLWCPKWITNTSDACEVFNRFIGSGGNFIDTANSYHESEKVIGQLIKQFANRENLVIATKFSFGMHSGDPNSGGNGRKHIIHALENSLRHLNTDYIDLYWMHTWDTRTSVEEVMSTLNNLVQAGKIRYIGLCNVPAWYLGRAQTIAELRGWEKICAIQLEYSLAARNIEFEYVDASEGLGVGICSWGPLANGFLTGKYNVNNHLLEGQGRLTCGGAIDPHIDWNCNEMLTLITELKKIAQILDKTPSQVALNWISSRPGVASTIIGASSLSQLEENLHSLEFEIPLELANQLDKLSKPKMHYPYFFYSGEFLDCVNAGTSINRNRVKIPSN
jgi:aryl-alcohol dehydrogenase-like predicted oxidoreductase